MAIQWLTTQIGTQQTFNSNLVLGVILVVFVLLVPKGIIPSLGNVLQKRFGKKVAKGEDA
jgi:branched-chain amino acid transport system permease protein